MSTGLYSGASGLALGVGLYAGNPGLWGGAPGLITGDGASLYLDFLAGAPLDSQITFTRASTATFTNSSGVIQSSAINDPRFDYNPVTLAANGLLIEEQRTNLIIYSEQFDNAIWTKGAATITADATTAPSGTATADLLTETAASNFHFVFQSAITTAGAATATVYAKLSSGSRNLAVYPQGTTVGWTIFNLATGVITATGGAAFLSSSITNAGNGWYRCSVTWTASAVASNFVCYLTNSTTSPNPSYLGDGTSGIFLYGAQLEQATFATSYIPTVASQVTRSADVATMTGTNFSSWYNQTQGTFVVSFDDFSVGSTFTNVYRADDGTASNRIALYKNGSVTSLGFDVASGGVSQANIVTATASIANPTKHAAAYNVNDFAASVNGGSVATDTSGTVPSGINVFRIGRDTVGGAGTILNGHIRTIAYYNTRLPNATLQALTA